MYNRLLSPFFLLFFLNLPHETPFSLDNIFLIVAIGLRQKQAYRQYLPLALVRNCRGGFSDTEIRQGYERTRRKLQ